MTFSKYIITHQSGDTTFSNAVIIPNNYNKSLQGFMNLFEEAKKDFPDLTFQDVECCVVSNSRWCKGCPALYFSVKPDYQPDGWIQSQHPLQSLDIGFA